MYFVAKIIAASTASTTISSVTLYIIINTSTATRVIAEEIICGMVCVRSWRIVSTSFV